ncbi:uncharacterized protein UBRO_05591 [Ustilago bromivora]|uniref:Uncharacterized protein n=1 Tax=Ustilago bromivora TaxID=307758 RepID=A0A1K0G9A0_9BASI|nr:uncharacterized protein UBRO_05591 [Ustilago bromivora]SYW85164.1 uncharacterized protein UBRO2_05735 [Ustilago bromivora]
MPRVKAKTPAKKRPSTPAPKKNKAKKPKKGLSKDRARRAIETQRQGEGSRKSKGKQRKVDHDFSNRPRDQPERSALLYSEPTMPPADIAWAVVDQDHPSLQHMYARADTFHSIPPLIPSTSSASSPTAARFTNPIASIHHNTPLILCIVIGAVVVAATLSVGLAWILRLACCAGERRAKRKRRLDRSTWSPSALASAIDSKSDNEKSVGRRSLDSVSLRGDDDLERKDAKIDALFDGETKDTQLDGAVPTLSYGDDVKVPEAPKSTWDGKGWTLFDPPVTGIHQPEPAVTASLAGNTRGGDYSAARHHQALELPTTAPLPYAFQAKPVQPASRMANRAVMNMLPLTLRNAATTASRQRATRKRYHDKQPYLESDFEGTIGGKDRELPIARRLRRTEERMAVDCTTEEESNSPLNTLPLYPGQFDDSLRFPRVQQILMPSPMILMTLINADSKAPVEFTPGLAGVGAAWSTKGSEPQVIEPSRASALSLPALDGDRRSRLLGSVGCWLGKITEAGEIADPYTALSPRPDRKLAKNGSLRSDYTSTTLADSATTSSSAQGTARTEGNASGKAELLLQHVDENLAEHDRQQRRLRKARKYISAVDNDAAETKQKAFNEEDDVAANVSRAPSIRPQFFAATDLKSWLEPNKVSTTYGIKVLEEGSTVDSDATDPFASDAEARKLHLRKYDSYESLIPEARPTKAKQRSSSSKQNLRSTVAASPRAAVKDASRQKREALRSVNAGLVKKSSQKALQSAWQSSADLSIVSSVFDEEFAAQSTKRASSKKPSTKNDAEAISTAKAEVDAAVRDAWRRRKLLSISSRGSQRIRTTHTTLTESEQFQAPLLSASCGAGTFDPVSEDLDEAIEMLSQADDAKRKEETEALLKKQMKEEAKKEAKKEAKREQRRIERQQARDAAAAKADDAEPQEVSSSAVSIKDAEQHAVSAEAEAAIAEKLAVRRTNMKQRSVSLGMARSQFAAADADRYAAVDGVNVPDSPWTSSDSDISVRRWGGPRRDDSLRRYQNRTSHASMMPHEAAQGKRSLSKQARANSYYYGMGAGSDLRDLC